MIWTSDLYHYRLTFLGWGLKRRYIVSIRGEICQKCGANKEEATSIELHHLYYVEDKDPWDYPDEAFQLLCHKCHMAIDHNSLPRYPNEYKSDCKKYPFILTQLYQKGGKHELLEPNEYDAIKYYGRIVNCGYITMKEGGGGRFDFELIVRECIGGESSFSQCLDDEREKEYYAISPDNFR